MAAGSVLIALSHLAADTIRLRDGRSVEGGLLRVDERSVVVRTDRGDVRFDRALVAAIEFVPQRPPLKVELRNARSDDSIEVLLNDRPVVTGGGEMGAWVDLTERLNGGNNALRLRIHNQRGSWAWALNLRINGKVQRLGCGMPNDRERPCRCCGMTGFETGTIDDLPPIWLFVDRDAGTAEVLP